MTYITQAFHFVELQLFIDERKYFAYQHM